jgi:hypothetical protein
LWFLFYVQLQLKTRNFRHHCQYTVKKFKIGFTLLTSMIDIRLTWTENKFQNLTFECHVANKEWFTSQFFEVTEKWCPKFRVPNCTILNHKIHSIKLIHYRPELSKCCWVDTSNTVNCFFGIKKFNTMNSWQNLLWKHWGKYMENTPFLSLW